MAKNIVLFSDGTGNSSGKLFRTNVWRLYQALDLGHPSEQEAAAGLTSQIAYYDDGVGTSSFKPLALLGGVFGVGLRRNVLDLYVFLCRNYEPGDRIYAFGFSRGAFTIRVLIGLVVTEGVLRCATEESLRRYARDAYRAYRKCYVQTGGLVQPIRAIRDWVVRRWRRLFDQPLYSEIEKQAVDRIEFVGVWDTVAAYGLPITEMTRGIDEVVWPLSMPNYRLSDKVRRARHALALDDERDTFHPLLWEEGYEPNPTEGDPPKLKQVWFAGAHSDVGGGYPDDGLAYVALEWMVKESQEAGLRFVPHVLDEFEAARNPFGPIHNPRQGLGGYYRYQPRRIAARLIPPDRRTLVMQDPDRNGEGFLRTVRIHRSVFDRIRHGGDHYAPIVLPDRFDVVDSNGVVIASAPGGPSHLHPGDRQEWVWNDVWRRRVNYFATVLASLNLAAFPIYQLLWPPSACEGPFCALSPIFLAIAGILPGFLESWVEAYAATPELFALNAAVIGALLLRSSTLQRRIGDGMREQWEQTLGLKTSHPPRTKAGRNASVPTDWVYRLRTGESYQRAFQLLKWHLAPQLFGGLTLAGIGLLAALLLWFVAARTAVFVAERTDAICSLQSREGNRERFSTADLCWPTGVRVEVGRRYRLRIEIGQRWNDGGQIATGPTGFENDRFAWWIRPFAVLTRRSLHDPWFQPLLRIRQARGGIHLQPVEFCGRCADGETTTFSVEFEAQASGEVEFTVNDAVLDLWLTGEWYANNQGDAAVEIRPTEP